MLEALFDVVGVGPDRPVDGSGHERRRHRLGDGDHSASLAQLFRPVDTVLDQRARCLVVVDAHDDVTPDPRFVEGAARDQEG